MDDIFVFGKTKQAHDGALISLMKRIKEFGLHIKLKKSRFALNEVKYLGLMVNKHGFKPDSSRTEAIKNLAAPTNLTELRSFLGTFNFYSKFVKDVHKLRAPLDELLKKNVKWDWS